MILFVLIAVSAAHTHKVRAACLANKTYGESLDSLAHFLLQPFTRALSLS